MSHTELGFIEQLDLTLRAGLTGFSAPFKDRHARFVLDRQMPDGGFRGRRGGSDIYYTDFALRTLAALGRLDEVHESVADHVLNASRQSRHLADVFNALNAARLLRPCGRTVPLDRRVMLARLDAQRLPTGGFARRAGALGVSSAVNTLLALLCYAMLDEPCPEPTRVASALAALRRDDGGYAERPDDPASQTAATAAVAVCRVVLGLPLSASEAERMTAFFFVMQAADGGVRAHAACETGDLLSTFNALSALSVMPAPRAIDAVALARFLKATACPDGGFRADRLPGEADIEYTCYGLGVAALLRVRQN